MSRNAHEFRQAREAKRIAEPVEDDAEDAEDDSLHDGQDWRLDAAFAPSDDTEGGSQD